MVRRLLLTIGEPMPNRAPDAEEPPPILSTWSRLYTLVIVYLVALIVAFYLFSRAVTPAVGE